MNYHLFYAFLLITFVLVIVPGPIVTLIIATGATRGIRSALMTVLGSTIGNALLLACIALGLNWILPPFPKWISNDGSKLGVGHQEPAGAR